MVRIRLTRLGAKKKPFYRVVVADSRSPRDGRALENLGHYNPMEEPPVLNIDVARADYWISKGAQPSETVANLIARARAAAPAESQA
jgi:small subunit ribosomal protein S16